MRLSVCGQNFFRLSCLGKVNPLKHVEDAIEQNDNNFDGIINNTPTPTADEMEAKARSGEQISLTYINLLTSGRLITYLADIDRQAQERFERLIEGMKQSQGITEQLKEENSLEWTGRLNNIRACAREIVNEEIVNV